MSEFPLKLDSLAFSIRNMPQQSTKVLISEMLDSRRQQICRECESNRVVCIINPLCEERRFLDLLITSGYQPNRLPSFCYNRRILSIQEAYSKNRAISEDICILAESVEFAFSKKPLGRRVERMKVGQGPKVTTKRIKDKLKIKTLQKMGENAYFGIIDDCLLLFDLENQICMINPFNIQIETKETLKSVIDLFRVHYNLNVEITEEYGNFIVIKVLIPEELNLRVIQALISKSDLMVGVTKGLITVEVKLPNKSRNLLKLRQPREKITIRDIRDTFNEILNLSKDEKGKPTKDIEKNHTESESAIIPKNKEEQKKKLQAKKKSARKQKK